MQGTRSRRLAFLILVVLALNALPVGASDERSADSGPTLAFVDATLEPFPSGVGAAGDGSAVFLKLTQPGPSGRGFTAVRGVHVQSTRPDGSALDAGWTIDMLETQPSSGVFSGSFRVSPPAAQSSATPRAAAAPSLAHPEFGKIYGDGVLRVEAAGRIIARIGTLQAETVWRPSDTAVVAGPAAGTVIRGYDSNLEIRVQDRDLNRDPQSVERYDDVLRAYSDSSPQGIAVPISETSAAGTSPNAAPSSAVFLGTLGFTSHPSVPSGYALLFVRPDDRVWVTHQDRSDAQGLPRWIDVPAAGTQAWIFRPAADGTVSLGGEHQFLTDQAGDAGAAADGIFDLGLSITVTDADAGPAASSVRSVNVTLTVDGPLPGSQRVELTSLGGAGLYHASITLVKQTSAGGPSDASLQSRSPPIRWIRVADGSTLRATYEDVDGDGGATTRETSTVMHVASDGVLELAGTAASSRLIGTAGAQSILLHDADANLDPFGPDEVTVRVRSASDPMGVPILLTETTDASGAFLGSFRFTNGPSAGAHLRVRDADLVLAEYEDSHLAKGGHATVRSNLVTWRAPTDAQLRFDQPAYARQMPASQCLWNATARLILRDPDLNDPGRVDRAPLLLGDESAGMALEAIETGPDTGDFIAEVAFGRTADVCSGGPARFTPALSAGVDPNSRQGNVRTLRASYFDAAAANGAPGEAQAQANWFESGGLLRFEDQWDPGASGIGLLYHNVGADEEFASLSPESEGTRTFLAVYAPQAPTGLYASSQTCAGDERGLFFREVPASSGRWIANISVTVDEPMAGGGCIPPPVTDTTRIHIADVSGKTVIDKVRITGVAPPATPPTLEVRGTMTSSVRLMGIDPSGDRPDLALGDRPGPRVELLGPTLNQDPGAADLYLMRVQAHAHQYGNTASTWVVETGPDTDVFRGSIALSDGTGPAGSIVTTKDPETAASSVLLASPHRRVCFWDSGNLAGLDNNPDGYANNDTFEPIYLRRGTSCGPIAAGDVRLTPSGGILTMPRGGLPQASDTSAASYDFYPGGTIVRADDLDVGLMAIDTWAEHYNGTNRVSPATAGSRFSFADQDNDQVWDEKEPVYLDLDGSGALSINDVRLASNIPDGRGGFLRPFTRVARGAADCMAPLADRSCGPGPSLRPLQMDRLAYLDLGPDRSFDDRDILYLDRGALTGDRRAATGDVRLTGIGDLTGRTLSLTVLEGPSGPAGGIATRAVVPATIVARTDGGPDATASIRWLPSKPAQIVGVPGYGSAVPPQLIIHDDPAGEFQDGVTFSANGGAAYHLPRPARPDTLRLYAGATERVPQDQAGDLPGTDAYRVRAAGSAAQPIADADGDGRLTCKDVRTSSNAVCTSSTQDLLNGIVRYDCDADLCSFLLNYQYRVRTQELTGPGCSACDAYNAGVSPDGRIQFGAPIGDGQRIRAEYRPAVLELGVDSVNGRDTEEVGFRLLPTTAGTLAYTGSVPVATEPAGSGLFVQPGIGARDEIRVRYRETLPSGATTIQAQSALLAADGTAQWVSSAAAQIRLGPATDGGPPTALATGPFVPFEILDPDADQTPQADAVFVAARNVADVRDTVAVVARETAPHSGIFRGAAAVTTQPCAPSCPLADGALHLSEGGGMIVFTYIDAHGHDGAPVTISSATRWRAADTGRVVVGPGPSLVRADGRLAEAPAEVRLRGSESAFYVAVQDLDANKDPASVDRVAVRVTTNDDREGETFQLQETAPSSATFLSGGIRFETTLAPGNGRVFARDGGAGSVQVRVVYQDPANAQGLMQFVEPTTAIRWDRAYDGAVTFDLPVYVGVKTDDTSGTLRFGGVTVADGDLNLDPSIVDRPTARVLVGRMAPDGQIDPSRGVALRLFETGANTGIFLARFSFAAANAATTETDITSPAGQVGLVPVGATAASARLRAQYVDAQDARGTAAGSNVTFSDTADWVPAGVGVVRLDRAGYNDWSVPVRVRLIDRDLDKSALPDEATVTVGSSAEPQGVQVRLLEDGNRTGIFVASVRLDPSRSSNATLHVFEVDRVNVSYADESPAALRTTSARIGIGEHQPPTTTLRTVPASPTGLRGAFLQPITVSLAANKPVEAILYRLGVAGADQTFTEPIPLREGAHVLTYWSIDSFGNVEEARQATIIVDLTAPSEKTSGLVASAARGGAARLVWNPVAGTGDPLEFYDYIVFRDEDLREPIGNTSSASFLDDTLTTDGAHTYRVQARDLAGRTGPMSEPVSVMVDALAPIVEGLQSRPATFDVRARPPVLEVSASATDARLQNVTATLVSADGTPLSATRMRPTLGTLFVAALDVGNLTAPCLCRLVVEAVDAAENNASQKQDFLITGPDPTPPSIGRLDANVSVVARGDPIRVYIADNVALSAVRYFLDGGAPTQVSMPRLVDRLQLNVSTASLAVGNHTLTVVAVDNAIDASGQGAFNTRTQIFSFKLEDGPQAAPGVTGFILPAQAVRRPDGTISVTWLASTDGSQPAWLGFQVWRSSSPYRLLANVTNPAAREHVDLSARPDRSYRYVVTGFTAESGLFGSLAEVPGYSESAGSALETGVDARREGPSYWLWILLGCAAVVVTAIVIAIALPARAAALPGPIGVAPVEAASIRRRRRLAHAKERGPRTEVVSETPVPEPIPETAPASVEPRATPAPRMRAEPIHGPKVDDTQAPMTPYVPTEASGTAYDAAPGPLAVQCQKCGTAFELQTPLPAKVTCPMCGKRGRIR